MLQGNTGGIRNKLEQDLKPAVLMNWKIWVPFQFLNFRFIPLNLQVISSCCCVSFALLEEIVGQAAVLQAALWGPKWQRHDLMTRICIETALAMPLPTVPAGPA